jgi:hypothetical protein
MITKKILLVAFCLGAFSCRSFGSEIFVRPAAWYVDYAADGMSSKIAPAIEIGRGFTPSGRHEVSVQAAQLSWDMSRPSVPGSIFRSVGDGDLTVVLGNYRFYFQDSTAPWRIFAGASVGGTKLSGQTETRLSGVIYVGGPDGWSSTFAGTFGVAARLGQNTSLEFAYRYLCWQGTDYRTAFAGTNTFNGPTQSFPATKAHVATLGLSFRF